MRQILLSVATLITFSLHLSAQCPNPDKNWRGKVAPEVLLSTDRGQTADILVSFQEKADVSGARFIHGKTAKAEFVYNRLVQTAARSQSNALKLLRERQADANSYYLVNAISVGKVSAELVQRLAELPEVAHISLDPEITFAAPTPEPAAVAGRGIIEWGVEKINAPAVWALGYTGQNVTVGGSDTGYDWQHPAIKQQYRGWNESEGKATHSYNWHDAIHEISPLSGDSIPDPANNPCGVNSQVPCDDHNHGTHTMGTMVGDDGGDNQIGVAPGARWVACRNMERGNGKPSSYIECLQWFLAPTNLGGQNPDVTKAPHVINNSWYCSTDEGCTDLSVDALLRSAVINLRASGIVVVVSNGNFGSEGCGSTYGPPAYFEESFSIGATKSTDTIAKFSSRGPVLIDGSYRMKPNVSAPGQGVRSCVRNGGYASFSGTSMAGPHAVGLVALVLSARPDLAGEVDLIEDIIEQTAVPLFDTVNCSDNGGKAYPNNTYGYGRVDALAAVQKALTVNPPLGVDDVPAPEVAVFPNPVRDEAIFDLKNCSGKTALVVFDANGRQVFRQNWAAALFRELAPVSLKGQPAGVYFWEIQAENGTARGKLMKE